MTSSVDATIL